MASDPCVDACFISRCTAFGLRTKHSEGRYEQAMLLLRSPHFCCCCTPTYPSRRQRPAEHAGDHGSDNRSHNKGQQPGWSVALLPAAAGLAPPLSLAATAGAAVRQQQCERLGGAGAAARGGRDRFYQPRCLSQAASCGSCGARRASFYSHRSRSSACSGSRSHRGSSTCSITVCSACGSTCNVAICSACGSASTAGSISGGKRHGGFRDSCGAAGGPGNRGTAVAVRG